MSITAQNRNLPDWFTRIRTRQTVLPRFQRFEAWTHGNIAQTFNTILRGLPLGAVLVLEIGNSEPFVSRPIVGAPSGSERVTEHLLDGQQRMTALWRGLHNNYEDRTYFVYVERDEETGQPYHIASIARSRNGGDTALRPFWANDPKNLWQRKMIPLDLCLFGDEVFDRYKAWSKEAIEDPDEREAITEIRSKIRQIFENFNLPFLSLPVTTDPGTALDVFLKMNTSAAPLSTYDIVVAQVEAATKSSLHDLVAACRQLCPAISEYYAPNDLVLNASALLQGKAPSNATYFTKEFGTNLVSHWNEVVLGIQRTVTFLEEERVFDLKRLPTDVVVPVLTALWARAPQSLDGEGRARMILRKYLWRAFFASRYEKSTASRALVDFNDLRNLIADAQAPVPVIFDDQQYPLPQAQELIAARWPTNKDRLARAILAVALREGARDLADDSAASRANLPKREYHHLFPDAYLTGLDFKDGEIYRSLNCALVTWQTNRNIAAQEPERYLSQRLDGTGLSVEQLEDRLASHLIPYKAMIAGDYQRFLEERAQLIYQKMLKLCDVGPG